MYRTTLDIDFMSKYSKLRPTSNLEVEKMINKILLCDFCIKINKYPSSFKGIHLEIFCDIKCDVCRMCYDDDRRFAYDQNRPEECRNILFEKKVKIKIG